MWQQLMARMSRLSFAWMRRRLDTDTQQEIAAHIDLLADRYVRSGMTRDEAYTEARRQFGSPVMMRQELYDMNSIGWLESAAQDLRYAFRQLRRNPGRALVVVLTLALGIAASTAMFSLVDALFLRPAPLGDASRLVWIAGLEGRSAEMRNVSYPDYVVYRDRATRLSGVGAFGSAAVALGARPPQRVPAGLVSGNYFDVIGLRAQIGRTFTAEESAEPGGHAVVVLSDSTWRKHFGADPQVVGTTVGINGHPCLIVGVAPRGFTGVAFGGDPEALWLPMSMQPLVMPRSPDLLRTASHGWLRVVGRLSDGVTTEEADVEIRVIARQVNSPDTADAEMRSARIVPLRGGLTPWEQEALAPLFAMIAIVPGVVLLVASANVANVLMAHHLSRRRELAMRRVLGASRGRLMRQLLAESVVLALLAAVVGYTLSFALVATVAHFGDVPSEVSALIAPDVRPFVAATTFALATLFVFAWAPAVMATRLDVLPILKDEGVTATAAQAPARLRRMSIVAQVALSLMLLIAAGLFVQSVWRAMQVAPGFDPHGLAVVSFDLDMLGYTPDRRGAFVSQFSERASALPTVSSLATANVLPFGGTMYSATIAAANGQSFPRAARVSVSAGYFKALELPVVRGRAFSDTDVASNASVAIVDETVARRLWPDDDPIGQRVEEVDAQEGSREIIGVAGDTKFLFPTESPRGAFYVPLRDGNPQFVVRTRGTPAAALAQLGDVARALDPNLPITQQTMDARIHRMVGQRRAVVSLLGVLAALTLALASVGIYGVAAHTVATRTREIGIRVALGARGSQVLRMIVWEQLSLTLIGVAVGTVLGVAGSTLLASFLFEVTPTDGLTFGGASATLGLVSLAASYLPARRAARLDPLVALRRD